MENFETRPARVRTSTVATISLIGLVVGFLLGCLTYKRFDPCVEMPVVAVHADTLVIRDTLRIEVPQPVGKGQTRRDTVWIEIKVDSLVDSSEVVKPDTVPRIEPDGALTIPIERKEYTTAEYRAVIEGWRPRLLSLDIYSDRMTITNTVTRLRAPKYAIVGGFGLGYDGKRVTPQLGFKIGRVLWSSKK